MKKIFLIAFFFSLILNINAQEKNNGIEVHSISFSPLSIYFANRDGGFGMNIDVSFSKGKHIFKIYAGGASEFTISYGGGKRTDSFGEYNILYGRELKIKKWFGIDLFAGAGYFNFKYNGGSSTEYNKGVIGFPLHSKIRFNTGRIFSLGLQLHSNINNATTIYQPGIFLQWKL
jgi:hypothetical protein